MPRSWSNIDRGTSDSIGTPERIRQTSNPPRRWAQSEPVAGPPRQIPQCVCPDLMPKHNQASRYLYRSARTELRVRAPSVARLRRRSGCDLTPKPVTKAISVTTGPGPPHKRSYPTVWVDAGLGSMRTGSEFWAGKRFRLSRHERHDGSALNGDPELFVGTWAPRSATQGSSPGIPGGDTEPRGQQSIANFLTSWKALPGHDYLGRSSKPLHTQRCPLTNHRSGGQGIHECATDHCEGRIAPKCSS